MRVLVIRQWFEGDYGHGRDPRIFRDVLWGIRRLVMCKMPDEKTWHILCPTPAEWMPDGDPLRFWPDERRILAA